VTENEPASGDFFADAHGHFVSTLRFELPPELDDYSAEGTVDVDPYLQAEGVPWPNMAVLLTLSDVLIGRLASRHSAPRISVTADLGVRLFKGVVDEPIACRARLVKVGRTMTVGDATFYSERSGERIGTSLGTFLASPRPVDEAPNGFPSERRVLQTRARSLCEHVGISVPETGVADIGAFRQELGNATQSLQGGVVALLGETATYSAVGALDGPPQVVDSLEVHYLAAGRVGPFRAVAEPIEWSPARCALRVEVSDLGRDRVIALIDATTRPLAP
jgi:acyl-coenzyme A thioesterase PaaI-like protein